MNDLISNKLNLSTIEIENRIFTVRGMQVMIDSHLAEMYGVDIRVLNQAVKRNNERFPDAYMFQMSTEEWNFLRSQFVTLKITNDKIFQTELLNDNRGKHRKYLPYVFTEQGVAMLSAVLKSQTAVKVSIKIINTFVEMRKLLAHNAGLFQRLDKIELKQLDADRKFDQLFAALESKNPVSDKGIFYEGQIFDAYSFVADKIRTEQKSIILVDNYIDDTVLTLFIKRNSGVKASFYTKNFTKQLMLDVQKHNAQYSPIEVFELKASHDRFLIIDNTELYHIGASLKDVGKKWFAFSKMNTEVEKMLQLLNIGIVE